MFIQHLPQDSATQTALRDSPDAPLQPAEPADGPQKFGPWALLNYQLAALTDAVNRVWYAEAVGKFKDVEPPKPMPRPGLERPVRRQSEAAVLYLDRLRARG
ncbi:MAG: hypothetical protein ACXVGF_04805 [Blastococcus sp.]